MMKFFRGRKVRVTKPYKWVDTDKTYEIISCMEQTHTGPYIIQPHYLINNENSSSSLIAEDDLISLKELREQKIRKLNEIS